MPYTISEFFKRTRLIVSAIVVTAFAVGNATSAFAQSAALVMADLCDDPAAAFDYEWSRVKHGSQGLFYMQANGTVSEISTRGQAFGNYDSFYVAAHGGPNYVGGFNYNAFATNFEAAHPNLPDEIFLPYAVPPWARTAC